jgi:hypothetical protein
MTIDSSVTALVILQAGTIVTLITTKLFAMLASAVDRRRDLDDRREVAAKIEAAAKKVAGVATAVAEHQAVVTAQLHHTAEKIDQLEINTNSKMDLLLKAVAEAAFQKGMKEGKETQ